MSKIIKAHQQAAFKAFDLREIEPVDPGEVPENLAVGPEKRRESRADALQELEKTIQKRLLEAEREAQELERQAYEEGYAQGQKDGFAYGQKSMLITQERLQELLLSLQELPQKAFHDYRNWMINAALAIARHIIGREVSAHPELLTQRIETLLQEAVKEHTFILHLNPKDIDLLGKHVDFDATADQSIVLKPDPSLERGGCLLESDIQLLDASIETQLAIIQEIISSHGPDPETITS